MSNTKIVIDKDDFDKLKQGLADRQIMIKTPYTEIQIDQTIEERARKFAGIAIDKDIDYEERYFNSRTKEYDVYKEGATQQQIIEHLKVKEKIVLDDNLKIKEKTTVLMEGTYYPNDGFWINGVKVFPDTYTIK